MSKTTTKKIFTYEALNILSWIESENGLFSKEKFNIRIQWDMKKNIDTLLKIRKSYEEFLNKIQNRYSDDKYSKEVIDGEDTKRIVIKEFLEQYTKECNELLLTENEVDIKQFDIEDFGDINMGIQDMEMLSWFIFDEE